MRVQHKYLCNTWTLPVTGVPRSKMWYFENKFAATGLIQSVYSHRQTDSTGRWNLLLHKDNIKPARQAVQAILNQWADLLPDDPTVRSKWNTPRRAGNDRPFGEEVSSEGDRTYATASMAFPYPASSQPKTKISKLPHPVLIISTTQRQRFQSRHLPLRTTLPFRISKPLPPTILSYSHQPPSLPPPHKALRQTKFAFKLK
jgi:hypothetical protein